MALPRVDVVRLGEICVRFRIARLDIFGSTARGDDGPDSDIDVLYELEPGAHLGWEIEDLNQELSELWGRPVDLVSRRSVHPLLRQTIYAESRPLYAA